MDTTSYPKSTVQAESDPHSAVTSPVMTDSTKTPVRMIQKIAEKRSASDIDNALFHRDLRLQKKIADFKHWEIGQWFQRHLPTHGQPVVCTQQSDAYAWLTAGEVQQNTGSMEEITTDGQQRITGGISTSPIAPAGSLPVVERETPLPIKVPPVIIREVGEEEEDITLLPTRLLPTIPPPPQPKITRKIEALPKITRKIEVILPPEHEEIMAPETRTVEEEPFVYTPAGYPLVSCITLVYGAIENFKYERQQIPGEIHLSPTDYRMVYAIIGDQWHGVRLKSDERVADCTAHCTRDVKELTHD